MTTSDMLIYFAINFAVVCFAMWLADRLTRDRQG